MDAFGKIDGFFNNAGIEGDLAPTHEYDIAMFDKVLHVNLRGMFLGLRFVLPAHGRRAERARWSTPPRSAPSAVSQGPAPTMPPSTARSA